MINHARIVQFPRNAGDCKRCQRAQKCLGLGLATSEAAELLDISARPKLLKRGEKLFNDGDDFSTLYAVRSGAVKTYKTTSEGEEQIIDFHLPGDLIGLNAIAGEHHPCHAVALDTTSVCAIDFHDIMRLCGKSARMQHAFLKRVSSCMARDEQFVVTLGTKDATQRLAAFLLALSQYHEENGFSATEFSLPMSRTDIANYLSLAVETVSRIFSRLQRDGVISVERNAVNVTDLNNLYRAAGQIRRGGPRQHSVVQ